MNNCFPSSCCSSFFSFGDSLSVSFGDSKILKLLALGAHNQFIVSELAITMNTVESHVKSILKKLGVDSRQKAALWPVRNFPEETGGDW